MHPWQSERLCQGIVPHSVRSDQAAEPSLREPELRRFVHSIIAGGLDWASASDRDLEFLEAVDTTVRLAVRWPCARHPRARTGPVHRPLDPHGARLREGAPRPGVPPRPAPCAIA